ncbi:hypothetical protein [Bacillus kwashiorkori]|uniref:hypothetical protein n=1 Tax=Bacillus kwashiorkori TaxID=1522318 RepID=UPI0007842606|nr:hypothetical protein [Bacillus kwashiorkori]
MEVKLVENPEWKRSAIIWFIFSAIQFWGAINYNSILFLIAGILAVASGIRFLTKMTSLIYFTLRNEVLTIHLRRLPLGDKRINYSDINKCEVLEKEILLHLKNGRIIKLRKDWISYDDLSKVKKELREHSITVS